MRYDFGKWHLGKSKNEYSTIELFQNSQNVNRSQVVEDKQVSCYETSRKGWRHLLWQMHKLHIKHTQSVHAFNRWFESLWPIRLIRLSCRLRNCVLSYTLNVPILVKGGQSSAATDHIWALIFDPLIHILPDFLDMQSYIFSEPSWWSINLSPLSLKLDHFENLTPPVKKVNDHLLIWPLSQERNIV